MSDCETQTMPPLGSNASGGGGGGTPATKLQTVTSIKQGHLLDVMISGGGDSGTEDFTTNSILEFLNQEKQCLDNTNSTKTDNDGADELDIDSIFEEINRLSGDSDGRRIEDILHEAEMLLSKQDQLNEAEKKKSRLRKQGGGARSLERPRSMYDATTPANRFKGFNKNAKVSLYTIFFFNKLLQN